MKASEIYFLSTISMNIIIKPYGSELCHCRPDTTWERENRDFYSPECVNEILWTPVVFARVAKAGKCIGQKFVGRYYDGIGCGMLMYCAMPDKTISSIVDHTSILPMPLYNPVVLEDEKEFIVKKDGNVISTEHGEWKNLLENALCKASQLTSLRIGDFVAVELSAPDVLASRLDGEASLQGSFCDNEVFGFKIIF